MRVPFTKPVLSLDAQIEHLRNRGMVINDPEQAKRDLLHVSYYRLSAYWLPMEIPKDQQVPDGPRFRDGANFETAFALHQFDQGIRRLIMDAMEAVEISIRGNWAHQMALLGGSHGYLDRVHYTNHGKFAANCRRLEEEVDKSKETFIKHYKGKYSPDLPPIWMVAEILSFGSLSHWYANLKEKSVRQAIAAPYGLDESVFKTLIHHLSVVRNHCAHHSRVWNRVLTVPLKLPKRPKELNDAVNRQRPKRLYNTLTLLIYILEKIDGLGNWRDRLKDHLATLPFGDLSQLGFPDDWETRPFWSESDT